jgi:hypothetical protein
MIGFEALFRSGGLRKQDLEHAPGNPHHALILAHADAELDGVPLGLPPGSGGKRKNMAVLGCSTNVLPNIPQMRRRVEPWRSRRLRTSRQQSGARTLISARNKAGTAANR